MSLKKLMLSSATAMVLMAGAVQAAAANGCFAVQVEEDGTGDYLIAPVYYAIGTGENGWETKLKVVNTNTTNAVVAKVVIREALNSHEIIDFPIYLTPGDVWEGVIKEDPVSGRIMVESTDDSMIGVYNGQLKQGSPSNPIRLISNAPAGTDIQEWVDPNGQSHKTTPWHGYVEIAGLAAYPASAIVAGWQENTPLDKMTFFKTVRKQISSNPLRYSKYLVATNAIDVSNDDLMGKEIVYNGAKVAAAARHMSLNLYALGYVSCDPVVNINTIGVDTTPDNFSTKNPTTLLNEMDSALGKSHVYVMLEGNAHLNPIRTHFTHITKKYWYNAGLISSHGFKGSETFLGQGAGTEPSTYYYTLNTGMPYATIFRNYEEKARYCKTEGDDVSGRSGEECKPIKIHEEVHFFQERDSNSVHYDASKPIGEYAFPEGGYADFDLRGNILSADTNCTGVAVIPTSFVTKKFELNDGGELYIHNWLYNQYKKAECPSEED